MKSTLQYTDRKGGVETLLWAVFPLGGLGLAWLGQAGFAVRYGDMRLLIDPYLSDHLAKKYRGQQFAHRRMMPPPILPEHVWGLDWVICSHRHSDHMDPEALPVLAHYNPVCRFVVPRAEHDHALRLRLPDERLFAVDAGEELPLVEGLRLKVIPSAHETLEVDERGYHRFLGFLLSTDALVVYHAGDCVPYPGLAEQLKNASVDIAMLPVNGRDAYRRSHGVPGNMTWDEAVSLCREASIPCMIPHHFGMFCFNTLDVGEMRAKLKTAPRQLAVCVPRTDRHLCFGVCKRGVIA